MSQVFSPGDDGRMHFRRAFGGWGDAPGRFKDPNGVVVARVHQRVPHVAPPHQLRPTAEKSGQDPETFLRALISAPVPRKRSLSTKRCVKLIELPGIVQ